MRTALFAAGCCCVGAIAAVPVHEVRGAVGLVVLSVGLAAVIVAHLFQP